eukprot:TRINITY_DN35670_c0_g1_i1.p1 TRINITY_DN35670_c0_g1~~TRINITY_DN35670_c0_g1_i1.p1  ORF type:complete len:482 (-),score=67.67 TRINITY_DN35670_c0_g1_i1:265-1710(-)
MSGSEDEEAGPCCKIGCSFVCWCIGCIGFPIALCVLATNEQNYVCTRKEIIYAEDNVVELPCSLKTMPAMSADEFSYFDCPIQLSSLATYSWCSFNPSPGCETNTKLDVTFASSAGSQTVEMAQCEESCETHTSGSGKHKTTTESCSYHMTWASQHMSSMFKHHDRANAACPGLSQFGGNPAFPTNVVSKTEWAPGPILAGTSPTDAFKIGADLFHDVQPNRFVPLLCENCTGQSFNQYATTIDPNKLLTDGKYLYTCSPGVMYTGCVRISYNMALKAGERPAVLAKVTVDGETAPQTVPASWMCSGTTKQWIRADGTLEAYTLQRMIDTLEFENEMWTWGKRVGGVFCAWLGVYMMFCPCLCLVDVIGDFISYVPVCGDFIEEVIEKGAAQLAWYLSCGIGCSLAFFVIGMAWLVMRPWYGCLMLLVSFCCCGAGIAGFKQWQASRPKKTYKKQKDAKNVDEDDELLDNEESHDNSAEME